MADETGSTKFALALLLVLFSIAVVAYADCPGANLSSDNGNCGFCGHICPVNYTCTNGWCNPAYPVSCPGHDTCSDNANCGSCGNACAANYTCVLGSCQLNTTAAWCGGTNLCYDPNNCGGCGVMCVTNYTCSAGRCLNLSASALCGGADLSTDPTNCGFCGHICPGTYFCVGGSCQPFQTELCCDNADNNNNGLIDAADPYCSKDSSFSDGLNDACYGSSHPYTPLLHAESGYLSCPNDTYEMRLYMKVSTQSGDSFSLYDAANNNALLAMVPSVFNGGQYGWTDYYTTARMKTIFNSGSGANGYGFDVAKVECYNGTVSSNLSCDSLLCSARNGYYCNGLSREYRSYFCSESLCKYAVLSSDSNSGYCGSGGASSMTLQTDKYDYLPGEWVKISGQVFNGTVAATDARVEISTSFGKWTTYSDFKGMFYLTFYSVPSAGLQEISVTAFDSRLGNVIAQASTWFVREEGEMQISAQASPTVVRLGETSVISGRVLNKGLPADGASLEIRTPWATYYNVTDAFGHFSVEMPTSSATGNIGITIFAQKGDAHGSKDVILTVNAAGPGNQDFTISAPAIVKPNKVFSVSGSWYTDGVGMNEAFLLKFAGITKAVKPSDGVYNTTLLSPSQDGCYSVEARNATAQVCVSGHDEIDLSIELGSGGSVVKIKGAYEDGSPVTGNLTYSVDSTAYTYALMRNGEVDVAVNFTPGRHMAWAWLNNGYLRSSAEQAFDVSSAGVPGQGNENAVAPAGAKITATAPPAEIGIFGGETENVRVITVRNSGTAAGDVTVTFGGDEKTQTLQPGEEKDVYFQVAGDKDSVTRLTVRSGDDTILDKEINVNLESFAIAWKNVVFPAGNVSIPYAVRGVSAGASVSETLGNRETGAIVSNASFGADLPFNGTIKGQVSAGTYVACVNVTNSRGQLIAESCADVVAKSGITFSENWFIFALAVAAGLLLLF